MNQTPLPQRAGQRGLGGGDQPGRAVGDDQQRWAQPTKPPEGQENNWIQTDPSKGWNTIFRLYGPLEPFYDKTWKPGDPELVE